MLTPGLAAASRLIPALRRSRASRRRRCPELGVVPVPVQEPEGRRGARLGLRLGAQQAGGDVGGHERRLDRQRARPAERVQQAGAGGGLARPGRVQEQPGGQVLLERRLDLHLLGAVPAPVQALAAEVDRDGHARAGKVRVDAHVGRARVDRRPLAAGRGAELVDDRVLDAHRAEARVPDPVVDAGEVDGQRGVDVEVARPVDSLCGLVELVSVCGLAARHREQDAAGEPRPQAGAVRRLERAGEGDAGADLLDVRRAQPAELAGEQRLESAGDGREEGEVGHRARLPRARRPARFGTPPTPGSRRPAAAAGPPRDAGAQGRA